MLLTLCCVAATCAVVSISFAQNLPPFPGFGASKQPIEGVTDETQDADAKRAWLFLEYPQLSLIPEAPARGTFYSLQKVQPPLPFNPIPGLPIYSWSDGNYFYDDLEVNYSPLRSNANRQKSGGFMKMDSPGVPGGGTNETAGSYSGPPAYSYTNSADLWIEIVPNLNTNGTATNYTLKVHNTLADIYYDVMSSTNLSVTNGWFVLGGVLATNDVSVLPDPVWPTNNPIQFFLARASSLDTDSDGLPDWWERAYGLDPYLADSANTGTSDGYKNPAGDGWSNLQKFQNGWNPGTFYTPAAPPNFQLTVQTNGFVQLFWDRALGSVTGYVIEEDRGSGFTNLVALGSSTNNFLDTSAPVSTEAKYRVKATYSGGNSEYTPTLSNLVDDRLTVNARIVRGAGGRLYLITSALPSLVTKVRISRTVSGADYPFDDVFLIPFESPYHGLFYPSVTNGTFDLALTNFVNGICLLPTNQVPAYGRYDLQVTGVGSDGRSGNWSDTGTILAIPFQDGSAQMKQNVSFLLRAPRSDQAFGFTAYWAELIGGTLYEDSELFGWPADYVQSGLHRTYYYDSSQFLNELRPFEENRYFRNFAQPLNNYLSSGLLDSGLLPPDSGIIYITNRPVHFFNSYSYVVNSNQAAIATALSYTNSQWILAGHQNFNSTANESGLYVNGAGKLTLATSFRNFYGLPIQSAKVQSVSGSYVTLNPGDQLTSYLDSYVYQQVAEPSLETIGYYFERVSSDWTVMSSRSAFQWEGIVIAASVRVDF